MKRREFIRQASRIGAAASVLPLWAGCVSGSDSGAGAGSAARSGAGTWGERSIAELQQAMTAGRVTSVELTRTYLGRIAAVDSAGPRVNSVIELNPEALDIAAALDRERMQNDPRGRGPLHGIPVLLKDNIDTHDRQTTTAGSLALQGSIAPRDSAVAARLRRAGAVLLGKTNMSEWANFRSSRSISGWSGRGGLTVNPHCLACSVAGSSSGSGAAVAAGLCAAAVGTETDGSIVAPSAYCGIVGLKPTVGLISRSGIIPISSSQDSAGPMARSVADAAALLTVLAGADPADAATARAPSGPAVDYTRHLDPESLKGARIGVARSHFKMHRRVDPITAAALAALQAAGAELVDLASMPSRRDIGGPENQVMLHEFKAGLNAYFASLESKAPVKSLEELIAFNEANAAREMPHFGQEILIEAQAAGPLTDAKYLEARERCVAWSKELETLLRRERLDAIVAPTAGPAPTLDLVNGDRWMGSCSTYAAVSGFPHVTVPCGQLFGLPLSLSFFGLPWTEARLIGLAYAFEQRTRARLQPQFRRAMEWTVAS